MLLKSESRSALSRLCAAYSCGRLEVDLGRRELRVSGVPAAIGERAFETLVALVQSAGELVTKDELMRRVWAGAVVEENTLEVHLSALRKVFGPDRTLLRTAYGRGYRLLGTWTLAPARSSADPTKGAPAHDARRLPRHNLPAAGSVLIGRAGAVQHLCNLLSAHRVVTLTGVGGIGKTRLALDVVHQLLRTSRSEAWLAELASLGDASLVPSVVARLLGLTLGTDETSAEAVAAAIGERRVLVVLDNCEHVVEGAARLTDAIMRLCPLATVLATSREVLRVDGEHVYRVSSLETPPVGLLQHEELLGHSAVQLFLARMAALVTGFPTDSEALPVVAEICRRLDGVPLAIEFAAARAATLGVHEVAAGLSDRFALLTVGRRTALPRHRTLRAALDWSYETLPQAEAATLRALAVLAGRFPLDAAVAVAGEGTGEPVTDSIMNLVAKSLVVAESRDGLSYFELLETVRLYALEKLRIHGEWPAAARRHAEHHRRIAEQAERESGMGTESEWLSRFGLHLDNWRAALDWAFSSEGDPAIGLALTASILPIWFRLSLREECRRRLEQALSFTSAELDPGMTMRLTAALAAVRFYTKQSAASEVPDLWSTVLRLAGRLDHTDYLLWARWGLWNHQMNQARFGDALDSAEAYCSLATEPGEVAAGARMVGVSLHYRGAHARARAQLESVLDSRVDVTARSMLRTQYDLKLAARAYLPRILWMQGLPDQAMREAESVVRDAAEAEQELALSLALVHAGCPVSLWTGRFDDAERFIMMLSNRATTNGPGFWRAEARCYEAVLRVSRGQAASGLQLFGPALEEVLNAHTLMNVTGYLAAMAGALADTAEAADGRSLVAEALAKAGRAEDLWCTPELLRLEGLSCLQDNGSDAASRAEALFRDALELAHRQDALSWALRAATSLAGLLRSQRRHAEARAVLLPVRSRFSEGLETADLSRADRLAAELR